MSRHEPRQAIARTFGATDVVAERGKEGGAADRGAHRRHRRRRRPRVRRHRRLDADRASPSPGPGRWSASSACRTASSCRSAGCSSRTSASPAAWRRSASYLPDLLDLMLVGRHRPRPGLRPHAAARRGRRGLPRDGRAPRDQGPAPAVSDHLGTSTRPAAPRPAAALRRRRPPPRVWVETADPAHRHRHRAATLARRARTFAVHGHHYALVECDGLEPGTIERRTRSTSTASRSGRAARLAVPRRR